MKIIYSPIQKKHTPRWEWNFGRKIPYPEKNSRVEKIVKELKKRGYQKDIIVAREHSLRYVFNIHSKSLVNHIKSCMDLDEREVVYPHIFPYRTYQPHLKTDKLKAGYYCFDVGTQIGKYTYQAAKSAVDVAMEGAKLIAASKEQIVFSLCRPPGHHADTEMYGGYCYFNNAAISAYYLSQYGRVAILDLDFHHGNGTQNIFYEQPNVLFISIHGNPEHHYPYFCGFKSENGHKLGYGKNFNVPLDAGIDDPAYKGILEKQLKRIKKFQPKSVVVSMGFDIYHKDPESDFLITSDFFHTIGNLLHRLNVPLHICLEGGYELNDLGYNAGNFVDGLLGKD